MTGREKIYRTIGGSLLGSNLTRKELMELSERLIFDPRWSAELGEYLRELFFVSYGNKKRDVRGRNQYSDNLEVAEVEIVELFKRRRARKSDALRVLTKASRTKNWRPIHKLTVRQNVVNLLRSLESVDDISGLVYDVRKLLGYSGDPYLDALS